MLCYKIGKPKVALSVDEMLEKKGTKTGLSKLHRAGCQLNCLFVFGPQQTFCVTFKSNSANKKSNAS